MLLAAGGVYGSMLYTVGQRCRGGVEPTDPLTIATVAVLLGCTAVGAAFVPAWRAGRTDPVQTLKAE